MLEMMNPVQNMKIPLKIYIGLDKLVGQVNTQCNVLVNINACGELSSTTLSVVTISFAKHFNQVINALNKFAQGYPQIVSSAN